ncbi:MAG: hypothetical protein M1829_003643 [Trizodia sp. TS-e1964]|nr:MAG: hypothetical protein M1829_003643 [Trizodia sp. TS-e1964]
MLFSSISFAFWRFMEILTLIPTMGMLSWFVHGYVDSNQLTPDYIVILFIVSVLACVWAIATIFGYHRTRHSAAFVGFIDLCFAGTFIGAVYQLRGIASQSCTTFSTSSFYFDLGVFGAYGNTYGLPYAADTNKTCAMLKACFAFGIMNVVFFFFTAFFAWMVHRGHRHEEIRVRKESHSRRHGHRSSGRRSSHRSHRSSTSRREPYV